MNGGAGVDSLDGGDGDDLAEGGTGADTLIGGLGDDVLYGDVLGQRNGVGHASDRLFGGEGSDSLFGGGGNDILDGGEGQDMLTGDAGADRFVFNGKWGFDIVADFEDGIDLLDLRGTGESFATLSFELSDLDSDGSTDDVLVKTSNGDLGEIAILNTQLAQITATDFIFG
jgi:Ca2+-binding RTX toxin-like protein